jgi:hypothetical protein
MASSATSIRTMTSQGADSLARSRGHAKIDANDPTATFDPSLTSANCSRFFESRPRVDLRDLPRQRMALLLRGFRRLAVPFRTEALRSDHRVALRVALVLRLSESD